ncbi:MAG: tol-pal system protein YbgF [Magnetococcales bacterium]|nr:tol-pal system protein YbgF [Magnetococcales bacterium]
MKARAMTSRIPVMQRLGRRCVGTVLPWLLVLSLAGCAGDQTAAPVRQADGQSPPQRPLAEWEKPMQDIDQKVEQAERNNRAVLAELQRKLAAQEAEMRQLRGNLEVVQHENKDLKDQVKEKAVAESDMDRPAFAQVEQAVPVAPNQPGGAGAGLPPPTAGGVAKPGLPLPPAGTPTTATHTGQSIPLPGAQPTAQPPGQPIAQPVAQPAAQPVAQPAAQPVAGKSVTPVASLPAGTAPSGKPGAAAPAATPQQMYDAAFLLLKGGQYNASREGFEKFLEKYPEDTLADHAQYWIGELYSVQKQYREALVAFNQVLTRWPTSAKVPPSLLKIGFAFYELGDMANARASLTKLVNDYPDSSAVAMARQRLQDIAQKEKESGKGVAAPVSGGKAADVTKPDPPGSTRVKRLAGD